MQAGGPLPALDGITGPTAGFVDGFIAASSQGASDAAAAAADEFCALVTSIENVEEDEEEEVEDDTFGEICDRTRDHICISQCHNEVATDMIDEHNESDSGEFNPFRFLMIFPTCCMMS
jgi:hypothetical protein